MRILYCISDHGFGHAARSVPVIQELQALGHQVIVRNRSATRLLSRELDVHVITEQNDFGVLQKPDSYAIDKRATKRAVATWMRWGRHIAALRKHIRKHRIDVVVSDSSPVPFLAAQEEGLPSVFIGSFTWLDIYSHLGIISPTQERKLFTAYSAATTGIILPFSSACKGVGHKREVALISMRARTGGPRVPHSVFYSLGGSMNGSVMFKPRRFTGTIITTSRTRVDHAKRIIIDDEERPVDHIGTVDAIIAKSGYGIVAEAVRSRKPMFLIERPGFLDDHAVISIASELGVCERITPARLKQLDDTLFAKAAKLQNNYKSLPRRYSMDGAKPAACIIVEAGKRPKRTTS